MTGTSARVVISGSEEITTTATRATVDQLVDQLGVDRSTGLERVDDNNADGILDTIGLPTLFGSRIVVVRVTDKKLVAALLEAEIAPATALVVQWAGNVPAAWRKIDGVQFKDPPASRTAGDRRSAYQQITVDLGATIDARGASEVEKMFGADLDAYSSAVRSLVASGVTQVTADQLARFDPVAPPPWRLTDQIESGDIAAALDTLDTLSSSKDWPPIRIVAVLRTRFKAAHRAAHGVSAGNDWKAKQAQGLARSWGTARLDTAWAQICELDGQLRTGRALPDRAALMLIVSRLAFLAPKR